MGNGNPASEDNPQSYRDELRRRKRVVFRTDYSGNPIAMRSDSFLANPANNPLDIVDVVSAVVADISGVSYNGPDPGLISAQTPVRGDWLRIELRDDLDVLRVVHGVQERGMPAHLNHVYFHASLPKSFDPNFFAGARFDPNFFAQLGFDPNFFAGAQFDPNFFAQLGFDPNFFAQLAARARVVDLALGSCCCSPGLADDELVDVPHLAARPADPPEDQGVPPVDSQVVEVHVIDVADPSDGPPENGGGGLDPNAPTPGQGLDENGDGFVDPTAGHGTHVQGIIERNSGLQVTRWAAAGPDGSLDDAELVTMLATVHMSVDSGNSDQPKKILNLSLSGYNEDDRPATVLADQIRQMIDDGWLIVASAGNNASCRLSWPAALPDVVAVGALAADCQPAVFSNFGFVDASALGVDVVSTYPNLKEATAFDEEVEPVVTAGDDGLGIGDFDTGFASWSGTSFAAPLVTARLAVRMNEGDDAKTAIEKVIGEAPTYLPGYGKIIE